MLKEQGERNTPNQTKPPNQRLFYCLKEMIVKSYYDDPYEVIFSGQGSLHSISSEDPYNAVHELRRAVEDVTGKPLTSNAMGFDMRPKHG